MDRAVYEGPVDPPLSRRRKAAVLFALVVGSWAVVGLLIWWLWAVTADLWP